MKDLQSFQFKSCRPYCSDTPVRYIDESSQPCIFVFPSLNLFLAVATRGRNHRDKGITTQTTGAHQLGEHVGPLSDPPYCLRLEPTGRPKVIDH
mmetsp:Transcript_4375/g.9147  ORF Transcript_4375/g.9147 Transcript_4375/m.9147 type:complete len:94 (+) Transcript_4375:217-498(+)